MKDLKLKLVFALITVVTIATFTWATIEEKKEDEATSLVIETIKEKDGYITTGWSLVQFSRLGGEQAVVDSFNHRLLPYNKATGSYYMTIELALGTSTFEVNKDGEVIDTVSNSDFIELSKSLDSMYSVKELVNESIEESIKEIHG